MNQRPRCFLCSFTVCFTITIKKASIVNCVTVLSLDDIAMIVVYNSAFFMLIKDVLKTFQSSLLEFTWFMTAWLSQLKKCGNDIRSHVIVCPGPL